MNLDQQYLELAKDPEINKDVLQKMVDEKARQTGYNTKAYHGTPWGKFNVFDVQTTFIPQQPISSLVFFSSNSGLARKFADKYSEDEDMNHGLSPYVHIVFIKSSNLLNIGNVDTKMTITQAQKRFKIPITGHNEVAHMKNRKYALWEYYYEDPQFIKSILDRGYDGIMGIESRHIMYAVKNSSLIKSADPVTYDDSGNIIPLSKRFNPVVNDIRENVFYKLYESPNKINKSKKIKKSKFKKPYEGLGNVVKGFVTFNPIEDMSAEDAHVQYGLMAGDRFALYDGNQVHWSDYELPSNESIMAVERYFDNYGIRYIKHFNIMGQRLNPVTSYQENVFYKLYNLLQP